MQHNEGTNLQQGVFGLLWVGLECLRGINDGYGHEADGEVPNAAERPVKHNGERAHKYTAQLTHGAHSLKLSLLLFSPITLLSPP